MSKSTELTIESGDKIQIAPPVDDALSNKLWNRWDRMQSYVPEDVNAAQLITAAVSASNAWYSAASKMAKAKGTTVDVNSLTKSVFNSAVVGLPLVDMLGYAHLVPMHVDKGKRWERIECQLWLGYKGYIELARQSGVIDTITPEIVWKDEEFERWNDEDGVHFRHVPSLDRPEKIDITDIRAAYVVTKTPKGQSDFEIVTQSTLKGLSRRGNVWRTNPVEMAKKSPVRRIGKRWPQTNRLAVATRLDEQQEAGQSQTAYVPEVECSVTATQIATATAEVPDWVGPLNAELQKAADEAAVKKIRTKYKRKAGKANHGHVSQLCDDFVAAAGFDSAQAEEPAAKKTEPSAGEFDAKDFVAALSDANTVEAVQSLLTGYVDKYGDDDEAFEAMASEAAEVRLYEMCKSDIEKGTTREQIATIRDGWVKQFPRLKTKADLLAGIAESRLPEPEDTDAGNPVTEEAEPKELDLTSMSLEEVQAALASELLTCGSENDVDEVQQKFLRADADSKFADPIWDACDEARERLA